MRPLDRFAGAFCSIDDPAEMRSFFREIFTPAELDDFVLRWRLLEMLEAGVAQRRIAERLGVSLCKITRGSKVLQKRNSVTRRLLREQTGET